MDDDLSMLERWRSGDAAAGRDLFRRHFGELYRFFASKAANEPDDLVQRTFTAVLGAREQFRGASSFRTYLFAVARNQLYTYLRQLPRGAHVDFEDTSIEALVSSLPTRLDRARDIELLRAVLRQLPAEQQLVLELHYWHDLDAAALAEVFEVPAGTIRVRLSRARSALRERMAEHGPAVFAGMAGDSLADSISTPEPED